MVSSWMGRWLDGYGWCWRDKTMMEECVGGWADRMLKVGWMEEWMMEKTEWDA